MKRKNRIHLFRSIALGVLFVLILCVLPIWQQKANASVWDNAYSYYQRYENEVMFQAASDTDGQIFYATKAAKANTAVKYRTIGWKVSILTRSGSRLQTLYFKLGGSYMYKVDTVTKSNYEYNLYVLPLGNLKRRMNTAALNAMGKGNIEIVLDACMVVVKKGKAQGAMSDSGPTSGRVYTTYSGISGAAAWSAASKQSFYSYFNKYVTGLFCEILVNGGEGISSASGSGVYFFGTYVTLEAKVKTGYDFDHWQGTGRCSGRINEICANGRQSWTAIARPKELTIVFHRNKNQRDTQTIYQKVVYGNEGVKFLDSGWNGKKDLLGWALSADASSKDYAVNATIKNSWIVKHSPKVDLYGVWKQSPDPVPPTPQPGPATEPVPQPEPTSQPDPTPDPTPQPTLQPGPESTEPTPVTPEPSPDTKKKEIRCRFISQKYFEDENKNLIPAEKGGLASDSRWATDTALREILRQALWNSN